MKNSFSGVIIFLLSGSAYASYTVVPDKVTVEQGADLVEIAITGTPNGTASLGMPKKRKETFIVYQVLGTYAGTFAWVAVNPWTADVWNMNECSLYSNPTLLVTQKL